MSRFLAAIYDPFMRRSEEACLQAWRHELLQGLAGDVLEIGAGTGANLAHYPRTLGRLVLSEPDRPMRERLERRSQEVGASLEILPASADSLPFETGAFDVVVSTLVLCTVDDPAQTLTEARRVLRPGGKLVFLEHVAGEGDRLAWQRRLEPFWKIIAGNCHVTRNTEETIAQAGFTIDHITRESMRKALPLIRPTIRGTAS